jgi:Septum formation initiator.
MESSGNGKNKISKSNFFVRAALLVVVVFCVFSTIRLQLEHSRLKEEKAALMVQIEEAKEKVDEIEARLQMEFDDDYIIRIAKEKLNLRLPEEIIFYNDLNN